MDIVQTLGCSPDTDFCPTLLVGRNIKNFSPVTPPPLPGQTLLNLPANGTTVESPPTLSWQHVSGAQDYRAQVSWDSSFSTENASVLDFAQITGNRLDIAKLVSLIGFDGLQINRRYYWRVAAINYAGQGPWSETRTLDYGDIDMVFKAGFE